MAARRAVGRRLTALPSIAFLKLMGALPMPAGRAITQTMGRIALGTVPRLRRIGMDNLDLAYGDSLTRREKYRILREAMDNLCAVAAELPQVPHIRAAGIENFIELRGLDYIDRDRGGLLISGHFGNWEWMPPVLANAGLEILEVVRPLDDPRLNAAVDNLRRCPGIETVPKDEAGPALVAKMLEGKFAGIVMDQCPRENAVPTTFLGAPCWTTIGPALVAMRTGLPVYPIEIYRTRPGRYVAQLYPAVEIQNTGDTLEDMVSNVQRCQDVIEGWVRNRPGHWLWFHRRWKKRPKLEQEWADRRAKKEQQRAAQEAEAE